MKNKFDELFILKKLFLFLVILFLEFGLMLPVFAVENNNDVLDNDITKDNNLSLSNQEEDNDTTKEEDILNKYSNGIEFVDNQAIVYGNILKTSITVLDIIESIDFVSLNNYYGYFEIKITDNDDNELSFDDLIDYNCKIIILSDTTYDEYNIVFKNDYNQDNVIDEKDIDFIIDSILEGNDDFTIEDVSRVDYVICNETYEMEDIVSKDFSENKIEVDKDNYVGEETEVDFVIDTEQLSDRIVISGEINYDENILKLNDIYVLDAISIMGKVYDNYFIYILDNVWFSSVTVRFNFTALNPGLATIFIDNFQLANNGYLLDTNSSVVSNFMIEKYGMGGDDYNQTVSNVTVNQNISNVTVNQNRNNTKSYSNLSNLNNNVVNNSYSNIIATTISLNNDTYIKELLIDGYDIDFNSEIYKYSIDVTSDVNSLDLNIILNSDTSTYYVEGNDNFKDGKNEVIITVQAEDGSISNYIIEVNKSINNEQKENDNTKENTNLSKSLFYLIVPIVLIILIILDIVYIYLKKEK